MDRTFHSQDAIGRLLKTAVNVSQKRAQLSKSNEPNVIHRAKSSCLCNGQESKSPTNQPCQDQN